MSAGVQHARLGDFELLAKVGEGGMGAVYKARQVSLDRIVAIKVLPRRLAQDKQYLERFVREARAMARLNHPNIVAGFDVTYADGYHYCVMEFVDGDTLRDWIRKQRRVPEIDLLRIGMAMASALAHVHAAGIVHRDVKPENIMIAADGTPKLTDLGLSKTAEFQDSYLTQSGSVVGTAHYMAPEQAKGDQTDGRSDLYSLGCTLYHAATGRTPFDAPTPSVLMLKHITDKMAHPQGLNPDLTDEFCTLLSRMVARKPDDRYATLEEAREDMEALLDSGHLLNPPLPHDSINFLPGPKATVMLRTSDLTSAVRASVKKSHPTIATSRQMRPAHTRSRRHASWIPVAAVISIVLLALAYALYAMHGNSDAADKNADKLDKSATVADTEKHAIPPPIIPAAGSQGKPAASLPGYAPLIRSLSECKIDNPTWSLRDGVLTGTGLDTHSSRLSKSGVLPANFELAFTLNSTGGFHFGWSTGLEKVANFFEREYSGQSRVTRYVEEPLESINLARGSFVLDDGKHTYSIAVFENKMKVFVDGRLLLSTSDLTPMRPPQRHYFALYAHAQSTVQFLNLGFRELSGSADFDAVAGDKH